jgi:KDO2-lipid IV(A) lauroyltransferase
MSREKTKFRKSIERALTRATAALFGVLVRFLPLAFLQRLADGVAWLLRGLAPSRQRIARQNLQAAFGDRYTPAQYKAIAAEATRGLCRTMIELFKLAYLTPEQVARMVRMEGLEYVEAGLAQGHGVIIITAHFGNWELLGAALGDAGLPGSVIARDSAENFTARRINHSRETHGMQVLTQEDLRGMLRTLQANHILGILPDQHAAFGGIIVDFLGRPAATAVGPATLALRTGCAVIPGFSYRQPDGTYRLRFFPPLELVRTGDREHDVRENTLLFNQVIGEQIREHPEQWLWLHRRWKVDALAANPEASHG